MELKEELYNIRLALVWRKQQKCNLRTITKILKGKCNDTERQNILARMSRDEAINTISKNELLLG